MINATPETKLDGIAKQMRELGAQLNIVFEIGLQLENLMVFADRLRRSYMNMATITGLDPCEPFDDTKRKILQFREARAGGK